MLKKKSKKILSVFFINFLLTLLVVLVAELIFGNWIFGPKYSVLNIPRNENRRFDVSKMMGPTTISEDLYPKHCRTQFRIIISIPNAKWIALVQY